MVNDKPPRIAALLNPPAVIPRTSILPYLWPMLVHGWGSFFDARLSDPHTVDYKEDDEPCLK